jgi:hypothetical protein
MKPSSTPFKFAITFILLFAILNGASLAAEIKPYKVALVIGDQWEDPASFVVDVDKHIKSQAEAGIVTAQNEFALLVIMLKTWGIPFEVTRLDQEFMDINRFVGPDGKPDVGCIIFDADTSADLRPQRYEVLQQAVNDHGISLIALADRIKEPVIQDLLGIKYSGSWMHSSSLQHSGSHFITDGLANPLDYTDDTGTAKKRVHVELTNAKPIITQGAYPQVTVRTLPSNARAVWIGGDIDQMFSYQAYRTLLRRAITWSLGYSLNKTWQNKAWLIMDDPGSAQNAWLDHWHYPTLTEQQIEDRLIKPLKQHNAILTINVLPAFVNDELKRLEPAFQRKFTDEFGTPQDYPSTYRGLLNGLKAGVFEVQCHGLTHMQPDLFSPPGPWYGADLDKERAEVGWYREFGDTRRNKEIPAAEASWRMRTAQQWIEHQFGVTPLSFRAGGGGVSTSYPNCTERLAALAGYGWAGGRSGYLGTDFAIRGWAFYGTMECPLSLAAPPDGHDKGIAEHPEQFLRAFTQHPDVEWIGLNEYVAYTHAKLSTSPAQGLHLQLTYDPHYCQHFKDHPSEWLLSVSDWLAKDLGGPTISVDGKTVTAKADLTKPLEIKIPAGLGTHSIVIE